LARDYERLPTTLAGLHFLAFAILMLSRFIHCFAFCLSFITGSRFVSSLHYLKLAVRMQRAFEL